MKVVVLNGRINSDDKRRKDTPIPESVIVSVALLKKDHDSYK